MNLEIYADKIFYYKSVIKDPSRVVSLIEETDKSLKDTDAISKWNTWTSSDGGDDAYVFGYQKQTNSRKLESSSEEVKFIYETLKASLMACGYHYARKQNIEYVNPSPISISKYIEGARMGPHVDSYENKKIEPLMSAVSYLNDDMEGGELNFPVQNITIKPEAGSIVVFPSVEPFFHQSLPIKSGIKYMSPAFWIKTRV
jgi:predicted 2-oxoglutarate/Fe(II)-dependent dioxygenase YbiX